MYEIKESYIVYTSFGEIMAYIDTDGDLHIMSDNNMAIEEVKDKFDNRRKG